MASAGSVVETGVMQTTRTLRRTAVAVLVALLALAGAVGPADAAVASLSDNPNDVPYDRGDITSIRVEHTSAQVDLRVRTQLGGQPVANWPNRASYIRWRINTDADSAPEYFADLRLVFSSGDTLFVGQVRYATDQSLVPGCQVEQNAGNADIAVSAMSNEYRFRFLRGCINAPVTLRARATFRWDAGAANVGPVYTDFAPNNGPTGALGTN